MFTPHITDYLERDRAREVYLAWLSRSLHALAERPMPEEFPEPKQSMASIRRSLLNQI